MYIMYIAVYTIYTSQSFGYVKFITIYIDQNLYTYPDVRRHTRVNCNGLFLNLIATKPPSETID